VSEITLDADSSRVITSSPQYELHYLRYFYSRPNFPAVHYSQYSSIICWSPLSFHPKILRNVQFPPFIPATDSYPYILSKATHAELSYGEACDPNSSNPDTSCNLSHGLTCRNDTKICDCANPDDMVYSEESGRCQVLANGSCEYMGTQFSCVPLANCNSNKICECYSGLTQSPGRFCLPNHEYPCDDTNENTRCAPSDSLTCLNKMCVCKNPLLQYWDEESSKCIHKAGAFCTLGEDNCDTDRSSCEVEEASPTGYACKCDRQKGFSPDFDGICYRCKIN